MPDWALTEGDDESIFTIIGVEDEGTYDITLTIFIEEHSYYRDRVCDIQIIAYDAPYFGIDLGTTYSCIAYQQPMINIDTKVRDTTIVFADDKNQRYCIPTAIYFPPNNHSILIGYDATNKIHEDPENVIYDVKRIMGRNINDSDLEQFKQDHAFKLTDGRYPEIIIPNRDNIIIRPEQALAAILIHLVKRASDEFGVPWIKDVVISTPAIFHDSQRKAVYGAANLAGMNISDIVVFLGIS